MVCGVRFGCRYNKNIYIENPIWESHLGVYTHLQNNKMFKYSYMTFDQCVKENNELQRKLNLEVDEKESERMCRVMYILFFQ